MYGKARTYAKHQKLQSAFLLSRLAGALLCRGFCESNTAQAFYPMRTDEGAELSPRLRRPWCR